MQRVITLCIWTIRLRRRDDGMRMDKMILFNTVGRRSIIISRYIKSKNWIYCVEKKATMRRRRVIVKDARKTSFVFETANRTHRMLYSRNSMLFWMADVNTLFHKHRFYSSARTDYCFTWIQIMYKNYLFAPLSVLWTDGKLSYNRSVFNKQKAALLYIKRQNYSPPDNVRTSITNT